MSSDVAIKVQNLHKCFHIYETPRDRLKQFFMPRIQQLFGYAKKAIFANSGRFAMFPLK